jgi:RHS repeat-associated protein
VSTHKYTPYGKELGGSSWKALQFTGHERDSHGAGEDDNLDYMHARFYAVHLGRLLSIDPIDSAMPTQPQSWNRYAYGLNSPLRFIDPTGLYVTACAEDDKRCRRSSEAFEAARQEALSSKNANARRAAETFGDPGVDNGVSVSFVSLDLKAGEAVVFAHYDDSTAQFSMRADVTMNIGISGVDLFNAVVHEGDHLGLGAEVVAALNAGSSMDVNPSHYGAEVRAYSLTHEYLTERGLVFQGACSRPCPLGSGVLDAAARMNIDRILASPRGVYQLTPGDPGPPFVKFE